MRWDHRFVDRRRRVRERRRRFCGSGLLAAFCGFAAVGCLGYAGQIEERSAGPVALALDSGDTGQAGQAGRAASLQGACLAGGPSVSGACGGQNASTTAGATGSPERLPVSSYVALSEVKFDPPGTDGNYEFIEVRGQPGTALSGFWLVAVEGDQESNRGQVDVLVDLAKCGSGDCLFDQNGLLLLVPDPVATVPPAGAEWRLSVEFAKGGLENGTVTLLLLAGSALSSAAGADWDINDDGVLEFPDGVSPVDAAAWTDGDSGDAVYAPTVLGPKPKAQAIWVCIGGGTSEWRYGQLIGESPSLMVDVAHSVPAGLDAFELTPGSQNHCQQLLGTAGASGDGGVAGAVGSSLGGEAGAGCGGAAYGGVGTASRAGAPSGGAGRSDPGVSSSSYGGRQGSASGALGGLVASPSSNGGTLTSITATSAAGRGTSASQTPVDAAGGQQRSLAGCAGRDVLVVGAPAGYSAGNSGWWSPTPFQVPPRGHSAGAGGGGAAIAASGGAEPGTTPPPTMPTGCRIQDRTGGSARWLLLLGFAATARSRRKASGITKKFGPTARQAKCRTGPNG